METRAECIRCITHDIRARLRASVARPGVRYTILRDAMGGEGDPGPDNAAGADMRPLEATCASPYVCVEERGVGTPDKQHEHGAAEATAPPREGIARAARLGAAALLVAPTGPGRPARLWRRPGGGGGTRAPGGGSAVYRVEHVVCRVGAADAFVLTLP